MHTSRFTICHRLIISLIIISSQLNTTILYARSQDSSQLDQIENQNNINLLKWLQLINKAMELNKEGKHKEASAISEIAYNFAIISFGDKSFEVATSLSEMAESSYNLGNVNGSVKYYQRAIEIYDYISLDTKVKKNAYLATLTGLTKIYVEKKNYNESEQLVLKIINSYKDATDFDETYLAKSYLLLGRIRFGQFKYIESRDSYLRSIEINERIDGVKSPVLLEPLIELSNLYLQLGNPQYCIQILDRALEITEKKFESDNLQTARILNDLGVCYLWTGDNKKSKDLIIKALKIKRNLLSNDDPIIALSLNNLGQIYVEEKNYNEALPYFEHALEIEKKVYGLSRQPAAIYLSNIGLAYKNLGNYDKAESYYKESNDIYENNSYGITIDYISNLLALANIKSRQNNDIEAEKTYLKAIELARRNKSDNNASLILTLNSASVYYQDKLKNYSKALSYEEEALKMLNFKGEITYNIYDYRFDLITLSLLINRASSLTTLWLKDKAQSNESLNAIRLALSFMERFRANISNTESREDEWERLNLLFEISLMVSKIIQDKDGKLPMDTFNFVESSLSRNLTESLSERYIQISNEVPSNLLDEESEYYQKRKIIEAKLIKSVSEEDRNKLLDEYVQNEKQLGLFIESLHERFPSYAQINYPRPISLSTVQNELLDNENIALAYFLGSTNSFLMVLTNKDVNLIPLNYNRVEISNKIEQLRNAILWYENTQKQCEIAVKPYKTIKKDNELLHGITNDLYEMLIEPASKYIKGKKEIIIVPYSNLWLLPFEALINKNGELLGSAYVINYQNSFSVWKLSHDFLITKPRNKYKFVGIGDAIYQQDHRFTNAKSIVDEYYKNTLANSDSDTEQQKESNLTNELIASRSGNVSETFKSCSWEPLSLSKEEVQDIRNIKGFHENSDIRLGYSAAEWNLSHLDDYKYVHFSTHGAMLMEVNNEDTQPALILTQINPEESHVDGVLTMEEVMNNVKLNADLVVLSACETGIGKLKGGEGVMSMARAFQYAGAGSVLTSLWKVHEDATKIFMVTFYSYLDEGKQPNEALYLTKQDFIKKKIVSSKPLIDYSDPFFWAAFVLIGGR